MTRNTASGVGGGSYNDSGTVTMQAGTITNNTAATAGGDLTFGANSAVVENDPTNCAGASTCPA